MKLNHVISADNYPAISSRARVIFRAWLSPGAAGSIRRGEAKQHSESPMYSRLARLGRAALRFDCNFARMGGVFAVLLILTPAGKFAAAESLTVSGLADPTQLVPISVEGYSGEVLSALKFD